MAAVIPIPPRAGALPDEWAHLDMVLGLTADLLPVVSNPKAQISPNSTMSAMGKTPSVYNGGRQVVGFAQWTQYQANAEDVARWSRERDYGVCIQTRRIRALDVDVADQDEAAAIEAFIQERVALPRRLRPNSAKFLLAFDLPGDLAKRRIKTAGGMIEFLATGQQFICCGQHPSGVRYEWPGGLPDAFPVLDRAEFEALWLALAEHFGIEDSTSSVSVKGQKLSEAAALDPVALHLAERGLVRDGRHKDGSINIECPFIGEHTVDSGPTETVYYPAHTGGYVNGHFKCLHAHCEARSDQAFLDAVGYVPRDEFVAVAEPDDGPTPIVDAAPAKRHRFDPIPADEFADTDPPEWIIDGILPEGELAVVFGEAASGKSFFTMDLAAAVARGAQWRGREVRQGRVVYIVAEGRGGFKTRIKAYRQANGLTRTPFEVIDAAPNLLLKAEALDVAKRIGRASIVVVDTFAQTTPGGNENSGEDMGLALAHCKGIHRATGALVILIHHAGKDSTKGARGWSGLKAAADTEIEVVRAGDARSATVTKQKDGEDGLELGFSLVPVVVGLDAKGREVSSLVVQHNDNRGVARAKTPTGAHEARVLRVLGEMTELSGEGVDVNDLVSGVVEQTPTDPAKRDRRREVVFRALETLQETGRVRVLNGKVRFAE